MRISPNLYRPVLVALLCCLYCTVKSQDCNLPLQVFTKLSKHHIEPKALGDSLSSDLFDEFLLKLDPSGIYFTNASIKGLTKYRYQLDTEMEKASCTFLTELKSRYQSNIKRSRHLIDSLLKNPLNFTTAEFSDTSQRTEFFETEKKLVKSLRTKLKYEVLLVLYRLIQTHGQNEFSSANFKKLAPLAQEKLRKNYLKRMDKLLSELNEKPNFLQNYFLKAIAQTFDPHSDYFNKEEMTFFEESLNSERQSFGIELTETPFGEVKIGRLVPAGSAWRSGQLHQGDLLVQLTWAGKETIDLTDLDIAEVDELLHARGEVSGLLTVIKSSGERVAVLLAKEKITNTENSISGYVLKGEKNIGYIDLPGFFTDESRNRLNGCANEMAKEIIKLNKLKIDGLILNLRNNGGGSLQEAAELAGIFIDSGPVSIIQEKGKPPVSIRDINKGVAFSGSLIILVNGYSASASELVSAALQDYKRAVIVGSKTYGKATGQVILPLREGAENEDFLKITVDRIYRLNQKSIQQTGVIPDLLLPDLESLMDGGENDLPHSLVPKTTTKVAYFTPHSLADLTPLKENSKARIADDEKFNTIRKLNDLLEKPFPLQEAAYLNSIKTLAEYINKAYVKSSINPAFDVLTSETSTDADVLTTQTISEIKSSAYIQEAFHIITDLIQLKK